ncbi:hypothetical protein PG997_010641 [Apiospora hydei]|uniref:Uncharacterized protein n=1 Tax=Apiospora hydei TaxID=1337664 RepID=A0ABR1VGS0_9PEZI
MFISSNNMIMMPWFILQQYYYPAPEYTTDSVSGPGPLRLGHIIPKWNLLENVINADGPQDLPPETPIHASTVCGSVSKMDGEAKQEQTADGRIHVRAAAAAAMNVDPRKIRLPSNSLSMRVKALETQVIQPNLAYVKKSVAAKEIASFLPRTSTFLSPPQTVYMITGLMIARGATNPIPSCLLNHFGRPAEANRNGIIVYATDSVWAIRLATISRGGLGVGRKRNIPRRPTSGAKTWGFAEMSYMITGTAVWFM